MDRHVQGGTRLHILVVDVTGVDPGRPAADAAGPGSHAKSTKEWIGQWNHDAGGDLCGFGPAIDRNDALEIVWEFVGQGPEIRTVDIIPITGGEIDLLDANFQHIAWHCVLDKDRAGQDVEAGSAILHFPKNGPNIIGNHAGRYHARFVDIGWIELRCGFDRDDVTG